MRARNESEAGMRVLDLYCGAGGAGHGYWLAGHSVLGVDLWPQPEYPHPMIEVDALSFLKLGYLGSFDVIHASPPCLASTALNKGTNARYRVDLIAKTRAALARTGLPYIIEGVRTAKLRSDLILCGEMFKLGVLRHRHFELGGGLQIDRPEHRPHRGPVRGYRHGKWIDGPYLQGYGRGGGKPSVTELGEAMGIDWITDLGTLTQAIPPEYTRWIGESWKI
jgi:hypothetical protein